MKTDSKLGKKTVQLEQPRVSRIRREPIAAKQSQQLAEAAWWTSREWEIRFALIGILFFAVGICAVVFNLGELLSR